MPEATLERRVRGEWERKPGCLGANRQLEERSIAPFLTLWISQAENQHPQIASPSPLAVRNPLPHSIVAPAGPGERGVCQSRTLSNDPN